MKEPTTINIFNESSYQYIPRQRIITTLEQLLFSEKVEEAVINVIVLDNEGIQKINNKHLGHDYPTDVLSFKMEDKGFEVEIYVSIEMAKTFVEENPVSKGKKSNKSRWREELVRYVIHGVLHILGYDHDTEETQRIMTKRENKYLALP